MVRQLHASMLAEGAEKIINAGGFQMAKKKLKKLKKLKKGKKLLPTKTLGVRDHSN